MKGGDYKMSDDKLKSKPQEKINKEFQQNVNVHKPSKDGKATDLKPKK